MQAVGPQKCIGIIGRLMANPIYICPKGNREAWPISVIDIDSTTIDVAATFCYLGHMLYSGWGCDSAIDARCCVA